MQFVQVAGQTGGAGLATATLPNNVTVGNTLVAFGCVNGTTAPGSTAVSDSLGNTWTFVASQAGASAAAGSAGVWVCHITTGGAAAVTLSTYAALRGLAVAEYSGVVAASPLDTSASASNSTGSTTPASGNLTTANAGDLLFSGASEFSTPVTWSAGAGCILRTNGGAVVQEQLVTATGTYNAAFTMSASAPWTAIGVALRSTAPLASNNMVIVSSNVFDGGSAGGDGNLTQQTLYVSSTFGDTRVTNWGFDFRDRKVNMTDAVSRYTVWTLDNLDRQTLTQLYVTSSGYLAAQSGTAFDARGRVYQTTKTAVDPTTGSTGNTLTGNNWYDPSSNLVQQIAPGAGQVFTKSAFNGVNWITASYTGYNTSGVSYSQAQTVTGDIVIEQSANTFDEVGTAISVASFMRLNDASTSTTGALTSSLARITYAAVWSDGIDRQIASANYGAASSFTRPSTPPSSSGTVLVNSTTYDEAGRVYETTEGIRGQRRTLDTVVRSAAAGSSGSYRDA